MSIVNEKTDTNTLYSLLIITINLTPYITMILSIVIKNFGFLKPGLKLRNRKLKEILIDIKT